MIRILTRIFSQIKYGISSNMVIFRCILKFAIKSVLWLVLKLWQSKVGGGQRGGVSTGRACCNWGKEFEGSGNWVILIICLSHLAYRQSSDLGAVHFYFNIYFLKGRPQTKCRLNLVFFQNRFDPPPHLNFGTFGAFFCESKILIR